MSNCFGVVLNPAANNSKSNLSLCKPPVLVLLILLNITLNSFSSFGARNANLNRYVANPFNTDVRLKTTLRKTAHFWDNIEEPTPTILAVKPENLNDCRSQGTTKGDNMVTTANFGDNNLKGTTIRRPRSQRKLQRQVSNDANPAINFSSSIDLNQTISNVQIAGNIQEFCVKKRPRDISGQYDISPLIQNSNLTRLQFGNRHNFSAATPNNAAVKQNKDLRPDSAQVHKQELRKCQRFSVPILKDTNSAAVKPRIVNVEKPAHLSSRQCIVHQDKHGNYTTSDGKDLKGPALCI